MSYCSTISQDKSLTVILQAKHPSQEVIFN
jgi:hypothetical protein